MCVFTNKLQPRLQILTDTRSRRVANYPGCFLIDNGGRDVLLTQLMLTLGPDVINSLYISLFLPNIQTSLWLQLSFSLTTCWYFTALTSVWDISQDLLINFYCWRLELEHLDSKCTSKQNEFENLLLWHFKKPCVFCQSSKHGKTKKIFFSLMWRKRLWISYWFKIQSDIIWRAELESHESRKKKKPSRINITYEVVFPK